eukprot:10501255-Lingulodinium_polyedra.AAC.1
MSPLRTRPLADLCDCLAADGPGMPAAEMAVAKQLAWDLFSGFGQSKVVEDGKRRSEDILDTRNKNL